MSLHVNVCAHPSPLLTTADAPPCILHVSLASARCVPHLTSHFHNTTTGTFDATQHRHDHNNKKPPVNCFKATTQPAARRRFPTISEATCAASAPFASRFASRRISRREGESFRRPPPAARHAANARTAAGSSQISNVGARPSPGPLRAGRALSRVALNARAQRARAAGVMPPVARAPAGVDSSPSKSPSRSSANAMPPQLPPPARDGPSPNCVSSRISVSVRLLRSVAREWIARESAARTSCSRFGASTAEWYCLRRAVAFEIWTVSGRLYWLYACACEARGGEGARRERVVR